MLRSSPSVNQRAEKDRKYSIFTPEGHPFRGIFLQNMSNRDRAKMMFKSWMETGIIGDRLETYGLETEKR